MSKWMEYYRHILQEREIYWECHQILNEKQVLKDKSRIYEMVFAPALIEYVLWVLKEAELKGNQRLYFLARDGYQMYIVGKRLCEVYQIPIECRYLRVSRYSLRVPEYHLLGEKCLDNICIGGIDVTFERIMKRAALPDEEAMEIAILSGWDKRYRQILNYQEVMQLKEELQKQPKFIEYIHKHSIAAYKPAIDYLKQEGLLEDISYAVVDSGWVGTLQKTLSNLVQRDDLEGYYFGMYSTPPDRNEKLYHSYYFGSKCGLRRKVNFSNCLYEAVYTSPEGMTLRYEKQGDKIVAVPDYRENPNRKQIEEDCAILNEYLNIYAEVEHKRDRKYGKNYKKDVIWVEKLFNPLMGSPTEDEVEYYGNLLFSDDVLEGNLKKVAAVLTTEEIRNQHFLRKAMIMLGLMKGEIHESAWIEGSIVRNGVHVSGNLRHAKFYKYFVYLRKLLR